MAAIDQPSDGIVTLTGGVVCGSESVGKAETVVSTNDRRELVEDRLNISKDPLKSREATFRKGPWKNYFLVELYRKANFQKIADRGTAFLTDIVRDEGGEKYSVLLTAGHVLFDFDRVKLKHSSKLLKGAAAALALVEDFIVLDTPHNKKKGWFEVCPTYKQGSEGGPNDYGAIFVKQKLLELLMDQCDTTHDEELISVDVLQPIDACTPIFVAGYPVELKQGVNHCMAVCDGEYRPHHSLPLNYIEEKISRKRPPLKALNTHTADTSGGMSGSPVVQCTSCRSAAPWRAIAIHVSGLPVDCVGSQWKWAANAPPAFKNGKGVNFAVPITQTLLDNLQLKVV